MSPISSAATVSQVNRVQAFPATRFSMYHKYAGCHRFHPSYTSLLLSNVRSLPNIATQRLMQLKTTPLSRYAGIPLSLLSCVFLIFYIWQHYFAYWLHIRTTLPDPVLSDHDAHRPPSIEYIDLASKDLLPPQIYNVYPDHNAPTSSQRWHGSRQPCLGPRGENVNGNPDDMLKAWAVGTAGKRRTFVMF